MRNLKAGFAFHLAPFGKVKGWKVKPFRWLLSGSSVGLATLIESRAGTGLAATVTSRSRHRRLALSVLSALPLFPSRYGPQFFLERSRSLAGGKKAAAGFGWPGCVSTQAGGTRLGAAG